MSENNALKQHENKIWMLSNGISLLLLLILISMWYAINHRYEPSSHRISTFSELNQSVTRFEQINRSSKPAIIIPTGIFIQSFEFLSSNTVQISGYVWQKIANSDLDNGVIPGVVFPEAKANENMTKAYEWNYNDYRVIGWRFKGVSLLQNFNYSYYPFDIQSIWIRMWPRDFNTNIILVPDLQSYLTTKPGSIFGLESDIVRQGFMFNETYFDMPIMQYDTSFGEPPQFIENKSLELYFNIIIKRYLINAFLIHLLPIVVIWCILFAIMMIITNNKSLAERVGLSTTQLFIALGGTIFSVILMSNNLRTTYAGQPVLYLEYFYFITYVIIILMSYDAYVITTKRNIHEALHHNLLPKTLYWPLILLSMIVITFSKFFLFPEQDEQWHNKASFEVQIDQKTSELFPIKRNTI